MNNLTDVTTFCEIKVHPKMDASLMKDNELKISHLYCHNSYCLSKPTFKKGDLVQFHNNVKQEMSKRHFNHLFVDKLDNL